MGDRHGGGAVGGEGRRDAGGGKGEEGGEGGDGEGGENGQMGHLSSLNLLRELFVIIRKLERFNSLVSSLH